jgi:small-conductance mechanosensitive channel
VDFNEAIRWLASRGVALLVGAVILLVVYRVARPAIHRVVPTILRAQAAHLPAGSESSDEVNKRAVTIEDLLAKLLRMGVLAGLVALVLAVFDLWSLLAGIALIFAAVMVASKEVVLDYVMGFLILVEGPYFKGDWISVGGQPGGVEGEVQEIGLRRTVLRDNLGAVHSVSNGLIRESANLTRVFSVAVVEFSVLRAQDLEHAIEIAARVAHEMHEDPAWSDRLPADSPTDIWVTGLTVDGASIRLQQRIPPGARLPVGSELRRRLTAALVAASIGTARWDTPLPILSEAPAPGTGGRDRPSPDGTRTRASTPEGVDGGPAR